MLSAEYESRKPAPITGGGLPFVRRRVYIIGMMSADDVWDILTRLEAVGIGNWVDGGWGVDALLGMQTRTHDDLDIVIAAKDLDVARNALHALGFIVAVDELPTRCVLRDAGDRRIDVHPVTFDKAGGGIQRLPGGQVFRYPPEGLAGRGTIAGRSVRCLTPELQLRCHLSYEPDDDDRQDVRLLCERFGLVIPDAYRDR